MKNLLICSVNKNLQESMATFLQNDFNIHCCAPSGSPIKTLEKTNPDICFFDREVISDTDINLLEDVHNFRENIHVILAYFYYEAQKIPEDRITSLTDEVILKPFCFDNLITKMEELS